MTVVINRSAVSPAIVCIACRVALGSAEKSVQGVRGKMEGPLHDQCATPTERRLEATRASQYSQATNSNGSGALANQ